MTPLAKRQGPQALIVDVWGDPEQGGQLQLLDPEDKV
jgi:type VI secretion system secreted protein VgrG